MNEYFVIARMFVYAAVPLLILVGLVLFGQKRKFGSIPSYSINLHIITAVIYCVLFGCFIYILDHTPGAGQGGIFTFIVLMGGASITSILVYILLWVGWSVINWQQVPPGERSAAIMIIIIFVAVEVTVHPFQIMIFGFDSTIN